MLSSCLHDSIDSGVRFLKACAGDVAQDAILPQVPPKICFQLLKEKEARKKLADLGLSDAGPKHVCLWSPVPALLNE
jgi:hypothetical protein